MLPPKKKKKKQKKQKKNEEIAAWMVAEQIFTSFDVACFEAQTDLEPIKQEVEGNVAIIVFSNGKKFKFTVEEIKE